MCSLPTLKIEAQRGKTISSGSPSGYTAMSLSASFLCFLSIIQRINVSRYIHCHHLIWNTLFPQSGEALKPESAEGAHVRQEHQGGGKEINIEVLFTNHHFLRRK